MRVHADGVGASRNGAHELIHFGPQTVGHVVPADGREPTHLTHALLNTGGGRVGSSDPRTAWLMPCSQYAHCIVSDLPVSLLPLRSAMPDMAFISPVILWWRRPMTAMCTMPIAAGIQLFLNACGTMDEKNILPTISTDSQSSSAKRSGRGMLDSFPSGSSFFFMSAHILLFKRMLKSECGTARHSYPGMMATLA
eukprot:scaffold4613_cov129-Isochrysis_galbana.AAC.28